MRYADGGGLTAPGRARREAVRLQAADLFAHGVDPVEVAGRLRVSTKSAYQWKRRWQAGGETALASRGPSGASCRLSERQLDRLHAELARGPAVHGWADQRWTLARVTTMIGRLFGVRYTLRGTSYLLHRLGYSPQVPARRATERDEEKITAWRAETWAKVRG
ncbi:winged helix-turn-helix domain-containing protein [Frankia sp. ACN1ag]|uniref:winged helix-turn-helix domain-containing protein n=1 Tax=Frankia sp. ACN1ag TaxID=102891 RepID=UPI0006DCB2F7|nr:winged helix-turn-helix domain-containing protein [Frankia sp. ACN1ag]KQC40309.1 DNA-binding protein [Frankia sp. ACN1ag]